MPTEPTGPNDPEVTDSAGQQLQPGPGASRFIDRPTGLAGESPYLSGSPGTASEPALVAANSSMVTDPQINADDTGRLVSGTDANGNTIPPDTFVGAVSDTGPIALGSNASTTTASNNDAKPWIGTFQLLNDSGQPVTLPNGFNGKVTLSAEGATSTVGSTTCPSGDEAATTSGCVTADPLYDPTDFTPGGGDTGTVLISPLIKPGTVSSTYYNHYSTLRTMEDLFLTGRTCTRAQQCRHPAGRRHGLRRTRRPGPHRLRGTSRSGRLRPGRVHRAVVHNGDHPSGLRAGHHQLRDLVLPDRRQPRSHRS